jgi:hypothetical protein
MPVELQWFNEDEKNLVYVFSGHWTWEETYAAIDKALLALEKINYRVYLIIDFRQTNHIPSATFDALNRIANSEPPRHPNTRGLIIVGLKRQIAMVFKVFQKIFPEAAERYQLANTDTELEAILAGV